MLNVFMHLLGGDLLDFLPLTIYLPLMGINQFDLIFCCCYFPD